MAGRPQPFSYVVTSALAGIVRGELDPVDEAAYELAARGRNHDGKFVGLTEAAEIYRRWQEEGTE